jgi:hypothetical protein
MNKKCRFGKMVLLSFIFFLYGCTPSAQERVGKAESLIEHSHFKRVLVRSGEFVLTTYQKILDKDGPKIFYIDGDGFVLRRPDSISENPTPINPIVLKLATLDPRSNVIYVARPCQYTDPSLNSVCKNIKYWTDSRMSDEVVEVMTNAIKGIAKNHQISLVGFSGGGGIAILIAPRLNNVTNIITIAGNLDIIEFTNFHNSNKIRDSLNPIDFVDQVKNIPQLHISGGLDKVVPKIIADKFTKSANSKCVKQLTIDASTHGKGWDIVWQEILNREINCK